jgi:hypothetical protein
MIAIKLATTFLTSLALTAAATGAAMAAPGDIHRVAGADVVNLRAGPPTRPMSAAGSSRATT